MARRTGLLAIALFAMVLPLLAETFPAPPKGWTDGYVMANGIRIHYWRTGGDKPPMILAHGSSDDGLCWTALAKELEANYDLILPDARGHGLSDPPTPNDPVDVQVEDLAGLIRELKLTKPIMMGHSMGAASVAWFAAKYPDVPRAVILEDPGILPRTTPANQPSVEERKAQILARNNKDYEELVAECRKGSPSWGLEECRVWAPSKLRHHPNTALRSPGDRPPMSDILSKITAPTLILKADAKPEVRKQNDEVAKLLKNGKLVHIDGAGHNVRREQKQKLLSELKPFLATVTK